jgi:HEAT repeat protein
MICCVAMSRTLRLSLLACGGAILSVLFVVAGQDGAPRDCAGAERLVPPTRPSPPPSSSVLKMVAQRVRSEMGSLRGAVAQKVVRGWLDDEWQVEEGQARPEILEALNSPDADLQWVALLSVERYGLVDAALFMSVLKRTTDGSAPTREAAFAALERFGSAEPGVVAKMRTICRLSEEGRLQAAILRSLPALAPDEETLRLLLRYLGDESVRVRQGAACGVASLDLGSSEFDTSKPLVEPLSSALDDVDPYVRACAARALERTGVRAVSAAPALVRRLDDDDPTVVRWATMALIACSHDATEPVAAALREGRSTPTTLVWILRRLGGSRAIKVLRSGLAHEDHLVRAECAMALHGLGDVQVDAAAALAGLLEDKDAEVLILALEGLSMMSDEARPSLSKVEALRGHPDARVRGRASTLLERLERD